MTLKEQMDPITWFEYVSYRDSMEVKVDGSSNQMRVENNLVEPNKIDYKKVLDTIQYFEYMSNKCLGGIK